MSNTQIKYIGAIGLISGVLLFNGCTRSEAFLTGAVAGAVVAASYDHPRYYDQPYYYYGGRYYYGGEYRNGYYYHNGHRYHGGHYYRRYDKRHHR